MAAGPRRHSPHGGPAAQAAARRRRRGRYPPSGLLIRLIAGCLAPSLMRAGAPGPRPSPYPALWAPAPPPRPPRPCRLGSGGASGLVNAPPGGESCAGCGPQLRPAHQGHLGHQRPSGESGAEATRPTDLPTSAARAGGERQRRAPTSPPHPQVTGPPPRSRRRRLGRAPPSAPAAAVGVSGRPRSLCLLGRPGRGRHAPQGACPPRQRERGGRRAGLRGGRSLAPAGWARERSRRPLKDRAW